MKNSCRRFAKRTLITLAALTAVSTVGFAAYQIGGFDGDNLAGTAQNLTSEKASHASDVKKANDEITAANNYATSVQNAISNASSAQSAAESATSQAAQANSLDPSTNTSNVKQ